MQEEFVPLSTVLGSFSPLRLHMRLGGPYHDYAGEQQSLQAQATLVHEHFHFLQTLLTAYGHWLWDAHRQMTAWLIGEWHGLPRRTGEKWRLPLGHQARVSQSHEDSAVIADLTTRNWMRQIGVRYWTRRPAATLQELEVATIPQPWAANPTVGVNGTTHTLQTLEIIEGHAYYVEATFLESMHGIPKEVAWDRKQRPSLYWIALQYFVETCGEERVGEFPFVCDLALQTSWDPLKPETEDAWRSLNPSWRFVRLTEVLRDDSSLGLGTPESYEERYPSFAGALLDRCGFRSLEQIAAERLTVLNRKPQLLPSESQIKAAIEFRQQTPWCGGNPGIEPNFLVELMSTFPVPLIELEGRLGSFGPRPNDLLSEMGFELQFQALADQLLGHYSPEAITEGAVECGFRKFGIEDGCEFQRSHGCPGRYRPQDGPPHLPQVLDDGKLLGGCAFEMLLKQMGVTSTDLDVDPTARVPTLDEITASQAGA